MKYFELILLLAASWSTVVLGKSNLYTGWTQKFNNAPYPDLTAQVGDTITFIWTIEEIQNVFIHPTNDCTQTGRIAVGNQSPTEYTFKPEDGAPDGKTIFFANDIGDRCESFGMRLVVTVFPDSDSGEIPGVIITAKPTEPPISITDPPVAPTSPPVIPTNSPVAPTFPPVAPVAPTEAPVFPTLAPVSPTLPPVVPTVAPIAPTMVPTASPVAPTEAPIFPTEKPTLSPTVAPFPLPTPGPTPAPTVGPTKAQTPPPTIPPLVITGVPTGAPVEATSNFPTESSNDDIQRKTIRGLQMTLTGIDSFSDKVKDEWVKETEAFCTLKFEDDIEGGVFRTSILVTNFLLPTSSRRSMRGSERSLQNGDVIITYNQVVSYKNTGDADMNDSYLAKSPFETPDQRSKYIDQLQNSNDPFLEAVSDASQVTFADDIVPTSAPVNVLPQPVIKPDETPGLSLAAIIGLACGVGALLIIAALFGIYNRSKKSVDESPKESNPPPANVAIKADEVSTLAGPSIPGDSPLYGDRSIGTVDYDYSKAYEDRDHSVSYAGGTLGSDTQDFSFPANAGATGAALGPYDDDGSFGDQYQNSAGKVKEEILHIFAPPGKLGVVIDTPDDGAPVVHAVKETSVVVDKVKVGDKLVAVDDEDVRTLTAIKVSKLISRKSANPSRKLTILRTTRIE